MGVFYVHLGDGDVALDHFECGVAEEALEFEDVAAVAEKVDGECVAEAVGVGIGDAGALAQAIDEGEDAGTGDGGLGSVGEEEVFVEIGVGAGDQVAPNRLGCGGTDGEDSLFDALAGYGEALVAQVDLAQAQAGEIVPVTGEFGYAGAGVEEGEDDGAVADGGGTGVGGFALSGPGVGGAALAGGEHCGDVVAGEWDDGGFAGDGT